MQYTLTVDKKGNNMTNAQAKQKLEQARELIREAWLDSLPQDIQSDLEKVYDDLKWIAEDIEE
jgi:hypothetical protein